MVWGQQNRGVDDLVARLRENSAGPTMFIMSSRKFGDEQAESFCQALSINTSVEELLCSGHKLTSKGAKHFNAALQKNRTLKRLCIGCSEFSDDGACALLADWHNNTLEHLDLEFKSLGPDAMRSLSLALQTSEHGLAELILGRNDLGDEGVEALATGIQQSCKVKLVDLKCTKIGPRGCTALGNALGNGIARQSHVQLILDGNPFGGDGLKNLIGAATGNGVYVESLSVAECDINDQGMHAFCQAIEEADSCFAKVKKLNVGGNKLEEGSWLVSLVAHPCIETLVCTGNKLHPTALAAMSVALLECDEAARLVHLDLSSNELALGKGDDLQDNALETALKNFAQLKNLKELRLLGNPLGDRGALIVAQSLSDDSGLEVLSLAGTGLTVTGLQSLLECLVNNTSLRVVELGGNDLGEQGREMVEKFKEKRPEVDIAVDKNMADASAPPSLPPFMRQGS